MAFIPEGGDPTVPNHPPSGSAGDGAEHVQDPTGRLPVIGTAPTGQPPGGTLFTLAASGDLDVIRADRPEPSDDQEAPA